jgi:hypothetical protein
MIGPEEKGKSRGAALPENKSNKGKGEKQNEFLNLITFIIEQIHDLWHLVI